MFNSNGYSLGMGGYCTPWYNFSVMHPNNPLGAENDNDLCKIGLNVEALEQQALAAKTMEELIEKQKNAAIASQWQNMTGLASNNLAALANLGCLDFSWLQNLANPAGMSNTAVNRIPENQITAVLKRMGSGTYVADRINQEIVVKDKDGKDKKTTILNRLLELVDAYRKDPENSELSKANYEKIWDIASKYNSDMVGDISSDEFAILKKIALNPQKDVAKADETAKDEAAEDAAAEDDAADDDSDADKADEDKPKHPARPSKYQSTLDKAEASAPYNYKSLSSDFEKKLYHGDANENDLNEITKHMTKYDILNTVQHFKNEYGHLKEENIIDAIFADTTRWGTGTGFFGEGDSLTDDAKPSVTRLSNLLIERTNDMIKQNSKISAADKKDLTNKANALKKAINDPKPSFFSGNGWWSGKDISKAEKAAISQAFQGLANALENYENKTYGNPEDD